MQGFLLMGTQHLKDREELNRDGEWSDVLVYHSILLRINGQING